MNKVERSSPQPGSQEIVGASHATLGVGIDLSLAPYGIFLLRVAIGADWVVHALLKTYRGMETHAALLTRNGISPLLAWPTFSFELVGGIMIILGIYSRYWSASLLTFLLVVVWVKWSVGWIYSNSGGGWEYPMFWFLAQSALVLLGDGAFALRRTPPLATLIGR